MNVQKSVQSADLSSEALQLLVNLREGFALWSSDAGEYPDRFWLEGSDGREPAGGVQAQMKAVLELQHCGLIEAVAGDPYRQCWKLVAGPG